MQRKIKGTMIAAFAFILLFLASCGDQKSPDAGYLSNEEISEIMDQLNTRTYTSYSIEGNLNYFDMSDSLVPKTIVERNVSYVDSPEVYNENCSSYYLRLPLHITKESYYSNKIDTLIGKFSVTAKGITDDNQKVNLDIPNAVVEDMGLENNLGAIDMNGCRKIEFTFTCNDDSTLETFKIKTMMVEKSFAKGEIKDADGKVIDAKTPLKNLVLVVDLEASGFGLGSIQVKAGYKGTQLPLSTKYQLESKLFRTGDSLDNAYYYRREGGGFYVKVFGVNKPLTIFKANSVVCRAKWNITAEYDEFGYLVSEDFRTINSSENNKKDCVYGKATYRFAG